MIEEEALAAGEESKEAEGDTQKKDFTVEELLQPFKATEKDLLEEQCVALFGSKKGSKATKDVNVPLQKFKNWWQEGKLDQFENIKFYLISRIAKIV